MRKVIKMAGKVYGNFTVIKFEYVKNTRTQWLCRCTCGNHKIIDQANLSKRKINKCTCPKKKSDLRKRSKEYEAWIHLRQRCYNPNEKRYYTHGARGIRVCDRWLNSYENFLADMGRAPSKKHSIDRINNNGNYEPGNCRWATATEQSNNTRSNFLVEYNGEIKTLAVWCAELNLKYHKMYNRLTHKWDSHKAFSTP